MIRKSQALKIHIISNNLKEMINLVNNQLHQSMMALKDSDIELAKETIKSDDLIDELQKTIDEECIKFIATERPVAKDLRRVFTASKIVTDLERMADLAVDICKITKKSNSKIYIEEAKKLWIMEQRISNMLNLAMEAYFERDAEKAYEICKLDDEIDNIYKEVLKEILFNLENEDGEVKANLLFVNKYLERMGDHVTNICEWIIFSKNGKYVDLNE